MVSEVCDDDGAYDGDIIFEEVGVGTYQTHETRKPSADYQGVAPVEVEIEENETTEIEIANTLRLGRIVIVKTNKQGYPLAMPALTSRQTARDRSAPTPLVRRSSRACSRARTA